MRRWPTWPDRALRPTRRARDDHDRQERRQHRGRERLGGREYRRRHPCKDGAIFVCELLTRHTRAPIGAGWLRRNKCHDFQGLVSFSFLEQFHVEDVQSVCCADRPVHRRFDRRHLARDGCRWYSSGIRRGGDYRAVHMSLMPESVRPDRSGTDSASLQTSSRVLFRAES